MRSKEWQVSQRSYPSRSSWAWMCLERKMYQSVCLLRFVGEKKRRSEATEYNPEAPARKHLRDVCGEYWLGSRKKPGCKYSNI